jgi:biotin carboxyl carrier protein
VDGERLRASRLDIHGRDVRFDDEHGERHSVRVTRVGSRFHTHFRGHSDLFLELPRFPERELAVAHGACVAPMPGKIVQISVGASDRVSAGDTLVVLEAMKMEHAVKAPRDGVVREVLVREGAQVEAQAALVVVDSDE